MAEVKIPVEITQNGWTTYDICKCSGILKYLFRNTKHPGLELVWRVKYYDFKIMNGGSPKIGYTNISKLKTTLESL